MSIDLFIFHKKFTFAFNLFYAGLARFRTKKEKHLLIAYIYDIISAVIYFIKNSKEELVNEYFYSGV